MAISNITALPGGIGLLPQIAFQAGFSRQLSQDQSDFQVLQLMRVGQPQGRELRYLLHTSGGPAAIQNSPVSTLQGAFPAAQDSVFEEKLAMFKQLDATIRISDSLAKRLALSGNIKYAEQMAAELEDKLIYSKRRVAADMHLDGTGVMSTVGTATDSAGAAGVAKVTIGVSTLVSSRGHVNVAEFGDIWKSAAQAGTTVTPTVTGTFYGWKVVDVIRESNQLVLKPVDSSYTELAMSASNLVATNVFYRIGQATMLDLTAAIGDYGFATEQCVGLESLVADDGRLVNGVTMSGVTRSIVRDKSGETADIKHLQELISALRNRNGQSASYKWNKVLCANEYIDTLVETQRQDLRFQPGDGSLGSPGLKFRHGSLQMDFFPSEMCRKDRQWVVPQGGNAGSAPVQFRFADFQAVSGPDGGQKWHLDREATTSRAVKSFSQYLSAFIGAYNTAPAACGVIRGATIGV